MAALQAVPTDEVKFQPAISTVVISGLRETEPAPNRSPVVCRSQFSCLTLSRLRSFISQLCAHNVRRRLRTEMYEANELKHGLLFGSLVIT